jgi:CBS domain containing-hemolysin-like protein
MTEFFAYREAAIEQAFVLMAFVSEPAQELEQGFRSTALNPWLMMAIAFFLVLLNGFFVAAEFAMVKVRISQIDKMISEKKLFAPTAKWLAQRLDHTLSACQLGITMASLALGYVGEPAFAFLITPVFKALGIESQNLLHIIAFVISFSVITSLHLVIGEQAPKIFAIRRPEQLVLWCAAPMRFFFYLLFPFMYILNGATELILGLVGLGGGSGHAIPHTEEEIRALLREAHVHGYLSVSEHKLLNNVFEFDDLICRLVMVPRGDVEILDINRPFPELLQVAKQTRHTRYPLCDSSLDSLLGVVHIKDLLGIDENESQFDLKTVMREPVKVPENMLISKVLKQIQNTHQLMNFVVDEYGTIIGIVTLENVLEKIIGPVDDEFDRVEDPDIQSLGKGRFMIQGSTPISEVEKALMLELDELDVDTVAGVLMTQSGKIPEVGDRVQFEGALAEIVEVKNDHAERILFSLTDQLETSDKTRPEKQ